ncbi:MAG: GNAT family N-acetyltransferase [Chlorobiales bacterium]|jgi:amino-acid N-acetyltransferase|nr:GNAT family N-acetyltransferase [Chlorobiales bacterium]
MIEQVQIVQASEKDWEKILSLLISCDLPVSDLNQKSASQFLIATDRSELVGCVGYERCGDYALLRSLAVRQDYRRRGIAQKLTSEMECLCKSNGLNHVFILTTTAYDFATNQGFRVVERAHVPDEIRQTRQFSELCPCSAICMTKEI